MLAKFRYVMCDGCDTPGPIGDNGPDARRAAIAAGWQAKASDGKDLCPRCKKTPPPEEAPAP